MTERQWIVAGPDDWFQGFGDRLVRISGPASEIAMDNPAQGFESYEDLIAKALKDPSLLQALSSAPKEGETPSE